MYMNDNDFIYCKGIGCPLIERCVHYTEGQSLPEGDWKWQFDCGSEHAGFMPRGITPEKESTQQ